MPNDFNKGLSIFGKGDYVIQKSSSITTGAAVSLFTFYGKGAILIITGIVTTEISDTAVTAKLSIKPDSQTAYDICAALSIRAFLAGSLLSITGTAADAMVGTTGVGTIAPGQANIVPFGCITSGLITATYSAAPAAGAIMWDLLWIPAGVGGLVVPA